MRRFVSLVCAALLFCVLFVSCEKNGYDEEMLLNDTVSLRINGKQVFMYDPLTCQMSFNKARKEFRAFTDNMSDYFKLSLTSLPSEAGDTANGTVEWTTDDDLGKIRNVSFSVEQTDAAGHLWLWNKDQKIFIVVRQF